MLIITCSKMSAQRLLGDICCRAWGELCSIVNLILQERWKNQALVGWSVWNYFSWTGYGLESCACLQLSVSSCYSGCCGGVPAAHPYIHVLLEKPSRAGQNCISHRGARKAGPVLAAGWSFSDPHSWVLCLAKLVGEQDAVVPRVTNRGGRGCSGMLWRQGCRDMKVSYSLGGGCAAAVTRLLPPDFRMAPGIGHMTPGNAARVSEVMSKHP